jgi:hypothetical protein
MKRAADHMRQRHARVSQKPDEGATFHRGQQQKQHE